MSASFQWPPPSGPLFGPATGAMIELCAALLSTEANVPWMSPPVRHRFASLPIHWPHWSGESQLSTDITIG
eukprot:CAMPEP_0182944282 /NCGR_PEP_ID=MMETSP0105_2-20130417/53700_1 /TAXON_ID=81532 ORGANISM="Acanthoeca-like sp., Strain 10tr" /NCGR_SAMPLE_ID=MMETSP0105_2 /ASSEMBLY_ACC=CAM_ASM_000205 /LENGTH=70 /DNA_ID=CAMNT_0025084201 /DNA_START=603 /DNA_END=815 /DNA_ORIENTATION=+